MLLCLHVDVPRGHLHFFFSHHMSGDPGGRISSVHENKAGVVSIVSSHPNKIQLKEAFVQHHSQ